jgi:acyl-CoA synthetase (AMP-forming)/AMP-acid ligase II
VMQGYFDDDGQTKDTIDSDGWLHTGDIAVMNERGYIRITDRKKDMYIMGGFNCYPAEIEGLLLKHGALMQAAVVGVPDERMGEVGMVFCVLKEGGDVSKDDLHTWCRDNMANYKVPRYITFVDALPLNATGKVQKFKLREGASELFDVTRVGA